MNKRRMFRPERESLTDQRRRLDAYHEAGHAVVAIALRIPFVHVTVEPDSDSNGCVIIRSYRRATIRQRLSSRKKWKDDARKRICIHMAGFAAIARLGGSLDEKLYCHDQAWNAGILSRISGKKLKQHELAASIEAIGSESDWNSIRSYLNDLWGQDVMASYHEYHKQSKRVFRILMDPSWWRGVEALARALIEEKTINHRPPPNR